jgi:hypothetical protein
LATTAVLSVRVSRGAHLVFPIYYIVINSALLHE